MPYALYIVKQRNREERKMLNALLNIKKAHKGLHSSLIHKIAWYLYRNAGISMDVALHVAEGLAD